jgi:hypothetical protein
MSGGWVAHLAEIRLRGDDEWSVCDIGVYPVEGSVAATVASLSDRLDSELDGCGEVDRKRWTTRTLDGALRAVRVETVHNDGESFFRHTIKAASNDWLDKESSGAVSTNAAATS